MIYPLYIFLMIISISTAFQKNTVLQLKNFFNFQAVPDYLYNELKENDNEIAVDTITVRFINTVSGKDVIVNDVVSGSNLLAVGDSAGISLPRACRTGLCGSCTCEVQDPNAIATTTNPRDGFATLRACSTKCFVPEGMVEMVVDVHRMRKKKSPKKDDDVLSVLSTEIEEVNSCLLINILFIILILKQFLTFLISKGNKKSHAKIFWRLGKRI
jgi:ferredoxin